MGGGNSCCTGSTYGNNFLNSANTRLRISFVVVAKLNEPNPTQPGNVDVVFWTARLIHSNLFNARSNVQEIWYP